MKLTKKQKKFLKTIENPKDRKHQKQQFKLQNKFDKNLIDIVFVDGEFKTDNPNMIDFFEQAYFVTKKDNPDKYVWHEHNIGEAFEKMKNSLTEETLRDLTEPKTEKPPLGLKPKYIHDEQRLSEVKNAIDRYFEKNKEIPSEWIEEKYQLDKIVNLRKAEQLTNKEVPIESDLKKESLSDFIERCKRSLLQDLDHGTCMGMYENCVRRQHYVLASKFREKQIEILSKFDNEKLNSFLQQGFINMQTLVKAKTLRSQNMSKTPDVKPLEFDLPKKENPIQDIECLSINDIIYSRVLVLDSPLFQSLKNYLIDIVDKKTNPSRL